MHYIEIITICYIFLPLLRFLKRPLTPVTGIRIPLRSPIKNNRLENAKKPHRKENHNFAPLFLLHSWSLWFPRSAPNMLPIMEILDKKRRAQESSQALLVTKYMWWYARQDSNLRPTDSKSGYILISPINAIALALLIMAIKKMLHQFALILEFTVGFEIRRAWLIDLKIGVGWFHISLPPVIGLCPVIMFA